MFKGLGQLANLGSLLKQAQQMGGRMKQLAEELKARRAEGSSGGGMITVEVNGIGEVLRCRIDPSLSTSGDRELIEDLLPAAINDALAKARQLHAEAIRAISQGAGGPGLDALLAQITGNEGPPPGGAT